MAQRDYDDPEEIYGALRSQPGTTVKVAGGDIKVVFADGAPGLDRDAALRWVQRCAQALATYFDGYPTRQLSLLIVAQDGGRVGHATTYGYRGPATRIHVGTGTDDAAFAEDWVLVHEMVHTALPDLPRRALWLQEGSATWIEPVARAQARQLAVSEVWSQALKGMPKGMRSADAAGMDGTREWGRLYWGGAIFWLKAEVAIFERSHGKHMLREALRAINRASGGNGVEWSPEEMMAVGDRATGTTALSDLYQTFSSRGIDVDLPSLFARLGVEADPQAGIRLNSKAELADLTRRITLR
jgi:hypothetical protein